MSKQFLAVGDVLINPLSIAYAIADGSQLRLVFSTHGPESGADLRLEGDQAREVLRWLRINADFLTRAGAFGAIGVATETGAVDLSHGFDSGPYLKLNTDWRESEASEREVTAGVWSRAADPN